MAISINRYLKKFRSLSVRPYSLYELKRETYQLLEKELDFINEIIKHEAISLRIMFVLFISTIFGLYGFYIRGDLSNENILSIIYVVEMYSLFLVGYFLIYTYYRYKNMRYKKLILLLMKRKKKVN
jgi:hypothetical protein